MIEQGDIFCRPFSLEDLQSVDPQFYNSLMWIKQNKNTENLELTFSVTENTGYEVVEIIVDKPSTQT